MNREKDAAGEPIHPVDQARKPYATPRLERFGTIRDLTLGPGTNNRFDGQHPPGQNKSRF